jgi:fatty acid elongase 3
MDSNLPFPFFDNWVVPFGITTSYLFMVFFLYNWMKKREAMKLNYILAIHNLILCVISIVIFVGFLKGIVITLLEDGFSKLYCGSSQKNNDLILYWASVIYLSKYYELLDTLFLILRKKPLTLLHVWHHFSVIYICWFATSDRMMSAWIHGSINSFVHILMYYYYAMQSVNPRKVWWRKYITSIQIVQFVIDLVSSLLFIYFKLYVDMNCIGSWRFWFFSNLVGLSYLYLFVDLYNKENKKNE